MDIKRFLAPTLGVALLALAQAAAAAVPAIPTITGPVPDPDPTLGPMFAGIRPSLTPGHQLADLGYVTEEFWVSGTACGSAYKTRIVIRRPADMSRFSGIVVAEPLHRGGNALIFNFSRYGIMQRGHVGVEIDARSINLNNANNALQSLQPFNPVRYGPVGNTNVNNGFVLASNNSGQANEVMAQVGRLLKTNGKTSPLRGYTIQSMVMAGTSDASDAVRMYLAGATGTGCAGTIGHTTMRMPDDGPIYDGFFRGSILNSTPTPALADVPHIEMPTQFEVNNGNGYRKPDSDAPDNRYRLYEVSGMSHNDTRDNAGFDPSFPGGQQCDGPLSRYDFPAMYFLGLTRLIDWTRGITPPLAPARMGVDNDTTGDGTRVATDQFGNATLGIRSPYLDVPLYRYKIPNTGPGSLCSQTSQQVRLPAATIAAQHLNPRFYAAKWKRSVAELVDQGWILPDYLDEIRADAKQAWDNGPESIFWRRDDGSTMAWYLNGSTLASSPALPALDASWTIAGTGDFDGEGGIDMLLRRSDGTNVLRLVNGGAATAEARMPRLDSAWKVAGVADFNGDGRADILWRNDSTGVYMVWLMQGGKLLSQANLPAVATGWSVAGVGDFNGDGKADILLAGPQGALSLLLMDGSAVTSAAPVQALAKGWAVAGVADFDGDGKADLLLHSADGSNGVWLMRGATVTQAASLPAFDSSWSFAATADYDGDGRDDVLLRKTDGSNTVWFMAGGAIQRVAVINPLSSDWKVAK